jgi:hypothetical protein
LYTVLFGASSSTTAASLVDISLESALTAKYDAVTDKLLLDGLMMQAGVQEWFSLNDEVCISSNVM